MNPAAAIGGEASGWNHATDVWVVSYAVWVVVLLLLYPACLWFARLKQRRRDWWLTYL
jgi:ABC-type spermidine/putrescine transport system permease subunit I